MGKFSKTGFGLDISDFSIELLELSSKIKVKTFSRIILEPGIVENGLILDKRKLTKKLKELVAKTKIKTSQVVLSLPESKVFIHVFRVPKGLKKTNLKDAIAFEAPKVIPLNQEEIYWDCQTISSPAKSAQQSVLYIAVFKNIIDTYIEVLTLAELKPVVFEIESLALARALLSELKPVNSLMIVDLGARTTNISIFGKNKQLRWSSTVPVAGNHFTQAIEEKLKKSTEQAEKLKRDKGLSEKSIVKLILEKELKPIINEIKNILDYYNEPVDEIILSGGSAQIPEIVSYFSTKLEKKVSLGKSVITKHLKGASILYNTVIGLALKSRQRAKKGEINLLPQKIKTKKSFINTETQESKLFQIFGYVFPLASLVFLGWVIINYTPQQPRFSNIAQKIFINEEIVPEEKKSEPQPQPKAGLPQDEEAGPRPPLTSPKAMSGAAPQAEVKEEIISEEEVVEQEVVPEEVVEEKVEETTTQVIINQGISRLNVRKGPGSEYDIIIKVYPGESYPLLQEQGEWYKIRVDEETEGWLFATYTTLQKKTTLLEEEIGQITIKESVLNGLNLRNGPGTNYTIITKVYPGMNYQLLQEQGEWYKIKVDEETEGWLFATYVIKLE